MTKSNALLATMALSTLVLAGCSDPIIGDWREADPDCAERGEFTVDDDLNVDGTLYIYDGLNCQTCTFDGSIEDKGDGDYEAKVSFDSCGCAVDGATSGRADCRMNDDEDRLSCDLTVGACQLDDGDWEKQDD
jgi:hypothetical protein